MQAVSHRRENPAIKHVGLFGAMKHRRAAQREGFDDVLFLNPDGTISEIATSNIGFVRGEQIVWPRSECLSGVTMTLFRQALDESVTKEPITISDLSDMDAAFATNAATGIRPITAVDGTEWPAEHDALRVLGGLYAEIPGEEILGVGVGVLPSSGGKPLIEPEQRVGSGERANPALTVSWPGHPTGRDRMAKTTVSTLTEDRAWARHAEVGCVTKYPYSFSGIDEYFCLGA